MKIRKTEVIKDNLDFIKAFVPDIRTGDSLALVKKRVGSRILVRPENKESKRVIVTFKPNLLLAVSKGSNLEEIVSLINAAAPSANTIAAIGTSGANYAGMSPILGGLAGASVRTLKNIIKTQEDQGNINLFATAHIKNSNTNVSLKCRVSGWTRTTDNDTDEIANIEFRGVLEGKPGTTIKTENIAKQKQIKIKSTSSNVGNTAKGTAKGTFESAWNLKTDGAFTYDTISLIQIATITMVFEEEKTTSKKEEDKKPEKKENKK